VRLVFAGTYDIKYEDTWNNAQEMLRKYEEHIVFLGELDNEQELANYYAALDVLLLTSDTECFALVQVEAMMCGTPVVMTDTPGGRVPVVKTGMGKLAPRGDAAAIGRAVLDVLENPEQYMKKREDIEAAFNLEETVDAYEIALCDATEGSRKRYNRT